MVDAAGVTGRGRSAGPTRATLRMAVWCSGALAVLLAAAPAVAHATPEPASTYDTPGQRHNDKCVRLARGLTAINLRYLSGAQTGFQLSNALAFSDGSCATGQVRLDLHEVVRVPTTAGTYDPSLRPHEQLVFHRGGSGYADAQNVRYGQLAVSQLSGKLPKPVPSGGNRGAACPIALGSPYRVSVQPIPEEMKYKSPKAAGGSNAGASYLHYGDPAAQQGDQNPQKYSADPTDQIDYSTLTWSWIDVAGGGHNRILLAPGQVVKLCDVEPIDYPSWAPGSDPASDGVINGWVEARYVQTRLDDGPPLYGWMAWKHHYDPDGPNVVVDHYRAA
jgi:hypothetical protein